MILNARQVRLSEEEVETKELTPYLEIGDSFKGPFAPVEVARYIASLSAPKQVPDLGLTKLNKLAFIAHGWLLGKKDRRLVDEEAEVWQYGPVYRSLYRRLAGLSREMQLPEPKELSEALGVSSNGDTQGEGNVVSGGAEAKLLDYICENYGYLDARTLVDLTHAEGSPWHVSLSSGNKIISDKLVHWYYAKAFKR